MGLQRVGHNLVTEQQQIYIYIYIYTHTHTYIYITDQEIQNLISLTTLNYYVQKNSLIEHNLSNVQGVKADF